MNVTRGGGYDQIVSDELYVYFDTFVGFWVLVILSCFGTATNSLNGLVFVRQGFKDGVNISLMSITFWDFVKCFCGLVHRMYGPISLSDPAAAATWKSLTYVYFDYTPVFASYVAYSLATYVSLERCLCVCKPFAVKDIFTPKFTLVMVVGISVVVFGAYVIIYFIYELYYTYSPYLNSTIALYRYNELYYNHEQVIMQYYKSVAILLPTLSFLTLCVCSAITVYQMKKSAKSLFSKERGNKNKLSGISQREKQAVKMLLVVIIVNIGNLFPRIIFYIGQLVEPEFYVLKKYHNFFMTIARFLFILDFVNASVNFFIFLSMSSNFRSTFYFIFGKRLQK